jgi:toluene monooxygenase system ferredoxin subunit
MADWHPTLAAAVLSADGIHAGDAGGTKVILMRVDAGIVAFRDACPHEGHPLSKVGERDGDLLICTKHLWEFEGCNGRHVSRLERPECNLVSYPVRVNKGMVEVDTDVAAPPVREPAPLPV